MKINIQPQDKRGPVSKSYQLHPDLHERLAQYADSIDSDASYVALEAVSVAEGK